MIGWWKKRWLRAKALSVLQNFYELPLKEPLEGLADLDLQNAVNVAHDTGGNEWDAAAGYVYFVALGVVSLPTITPDDAKAIYPALHVTNTYHRMAKADSMRPLIRDVVQRWNAHPDHPSNRKGRAS